jgi:beta-phosphoglucomutase-like phosphatase (HAD superfamily)
MAALDTCFPVIVSADDPVASKPSPEPYQLALARLGGGTFVPSACVAIEDSRWGIVSARAAGMRVVGVTSSYAADALSEADLVVSSVADLSLTVLGQLVDGPPRR